MSLRRIRRFPLLHGLGVLAALVAALAVAAGGAAPILPCQRGGNRGGADRGPTSPILRNDGPFDDLKVGPSTVVKFGPGDYRQWYEAIDAQNSPGGPDFLTQAA